MKILVASLFVVLMRQGAFAQEKVSNARNATPQPVTENQAETPVSDSVTVHSTSRTGKPVKVPASPEAVPVAEPKAVSPARKPE